MSHLCEEFKRDEAEEHVKSKHKPNHRSLSVEEETEILKKFEKKAGTGKIVTVKGIKKEFDKRIGKDTGRGYIYMLLKRLNFRKTMPRSRHLKRASEEEIACSKKI